MLQPCIVRPKKIATLWPCTSLQKDQNRYNFLQVTLTHLFHSDRNSQSSQPQSLSLHPSAIPFVAAPVREKARHAHHSAMIEKAFNVSFDGINSDRFEKLWDQSKNDFCIGVD
jgi:hypothetical protein